MSERQAVPWLKFYPSDWRSDPKLRMCSIAARGLWMEMLCLMHEADPRGSLLVNGSPVSDKQLASLAGIAAREASTLVEELGAAGVFSRDGLGVIYSRRIRRDIEKAARDKANGHKGGNPFITPGVNPPDNGGDKAHIPEARNQENKYTNGSSAARSFPPDGRIAYGPFAEIAQKHGRGIDIELLGSAFRNWCRTQDIAFDSPWITQTFAKFCQKHRIGRAA